MVRPHIRLCHQILAEALKAGYRDLELVSTAGEMPTVRTKLDGDWKSLMAFPQPVYDSIIGYLEEMADIPRDEPAGKGTIHVQLGNADASISATARQNSQGLRELVLHFPKAPNNTAAV
jgi:hypothetical protein